MLRAARPALRSLTRGAATAPAAASAVQASFKEVKFVKEDVQAVMKELPEFEFYQIKEGVANPYSNHTMDVSVLLDPPVAAPVKSTVEFSKLENGLKIASVDRGGLAASIGLFVNAGSRFEDGSNLGVSHMVELMAFKSTAHLSHLRTVKTLETMGASLTTTCKAGREDIAYTAEVPRELVPLAVPLLVGNVLFPRLLPWEVKTAQGQVAVAKGAVTADEAISQLLHKTAFCNNTLGHNVVAADRSIAYFTPDTIRNFMLDHFAPERMAVVGVNVSHEELSKWVMRSFADYNAIPLKARADTKAAYTGGYSLEEGSSPFCHLAIGFESGSWGSDAAATQVLQTLLGGTSVAGSIGSGVTTRLGAQVVKQSPYVESSSAFNIAYSDTGLFGVYTVCQGDKAGEVTASVMKALAGLSSIKGDELAKAKAMLKGNLARSLDSTSDIMSDMGKQLLLSGSYASPDQLVKAIDAVTEAQVVSAAKKILSSKVTVAAFGETHAVPALSAIEAMLK